MNLMMKELTVSNEVLRAQKNSLERELNEMNQNMEFKFGATNRNTSFGASSRYGILNTHKEFAYVN